MAVRCENNHVINRACIGPGSKGLQSSRRRDVSIALDCDTSPLCHLPGIEETDRATTANRIMAPPHLQGRLRRHPPAIRRRALKPCVATQTLLELRPVYGTPTSVEPDEDTHAKHKASASGRRHVDRVLCVVDVECVR